MSTRAFTEEMKVAIDSSISKHMLTMTASSSAMTASISVLTAEIGELKQSLTQRDAKIASLEQKIAVLEARPDTSRFIARLEQLEADHDDLEQYGRRLNIRVENVPLQQDEAPAALETQVIGFLADAGAAIQSADILRLHRSTAPRTKEGSGASTRYSQVIVRLNNWKARESAHNARNSARTTGHAIKQDLTRFRRELISEANASIRGWSEADEPVYCYANINCQVVMRRGRTVRRIHTEDDLKNALVYFRPQ